MLTILTTICWGSRANELELAKGWRFELLYYDYSIGVALRAVVVDAITYRADAAAKRAATWKGIRLAICRKRNRCRGGGEVRLGRKTHNSRLVLIGSAPQFPGWVAILAGCAWPAQKSDRSTSRTSMPCNASSRSEPIQLMPTTTMRTGTSGWLRSEANSGRIRVPWEGKPNHRSAFAVCHFLSRQFRIHEGCSHVISIRRRETVPAYV
jgi:hypothetical protein